MKTILDQLILLNYQYQEAWIRLQASIQKSLNNDNLYNRSISTSDSDMDSLVKTDCLETTDNYNKITP